MKCNIRTNKGTKEVPCYKTSYKNVVIAKIGKHCYSITHWQIGMALSYNRYSTKKDAEMELPEVIEKVRSIKVGSMKQFCKQHGMEQINF